MLLGHPQTDVRAASQEARFGQSQPELSELSEAARREERARGVPQREALASPEGPELLGERSLARCRRRGFRPRWRHDPILIGLADRPAEAVHLAGRIDDRAIASAATQVARERVVD